jgi:hypothetical protein
MTKDEEYESTERDTRYEEQIEELKSLVSRAVALVHLTGEQARWTGWLRDAGKVG